MVVVYINMFADSLMITYVYIRIEMEYYRRVKIAKFSICYKDLQDIWGRNPYTYFLYIVTVNLELSMSIFDEN